MLDTGGVDRARRMEQIGVLMPVPDDLNVAVLFDQVLRLLPVMERGERSGHPRPHFSVDTRAPENVALVNLGAVRVLETGELHDDHLGLAIRQIDTVVSLVAGRPADDDRSGIVPHP